MSEPGPAFTSRAAIERTLNHERAAWRAGIETMGAGLRVGTILCAGAAVSRMGTCARLVAATPWAERRPRGWRALVRFAVACCGLTARIAGVLAREVLSQSLPFTAGDAP